MVVVGAVRGIEELTYLVPAEMEGRVRPGHRVLAPLRSRKVTGVVLETAPSLSRHQRASEAHPGIARAAAAVQSRASPDDGIPRDVLHGAAGGSLSKRDSRRRTRRVAPDVQARAPTRCAAAGGISRSNEESPKRSRSIQSIRARLRGWGLSAPWLRRLRPLCAKASSRRSIRRAGAIATRAIRWRILWTIQRHRRCAERPSVRLFG